MTLLHISHPFSLVAIIASAITDNTAVDVVISRRWRWWFTICFIGWIRSQGSCGGGGVHRLRLFMFDQSIELIKKQRRCVLNKLSR